MARPYTLKRRAEQQAETRRRIVAAAIDLHSSIGPAAASFSLVAERAGVQRHTLYAHFPDERALLQACSGHELQRDPLPDARQWQAVADRRARLRAGLAALYRWYERNAGMLGCVLRDAEHHAPTAEIVEQRMAPALAQYRRILGSRLGKKQAALLQLALSFFAWRSLAGDSGLNSDLAAELMAQAIDAAT